MHHFGAFQPDWNMLCHDLMGKSILITGGARSGKSTLAERMTLALGQPAIYIATAQAHDAEMADRISRHQDRRGPEWRTVQEPRDLLGALVASDGQGPRLVDCLTLWLTNMMLADEDWQSATLALAQALPLQTSPVLFVTNEVGAGIVPENALARAFRDAAGLVNQQIAKACDELWFCVAGHPLRVKPT
jgi:adenosylcobinamide kinase/adenosylcobinamide-phosphate guanylyltransferase